MSRAKSSLRICPCGVILRKHQKYYCSRKCMHTNISWKKKMSRSVHYRNYPKRKCHVCAKVFIPFNIRHRICKECRRGHFNNITARARLDRYGITTADIKSIVKRQKGLCALCPRLPKFVDHCHKTRAVRGMLCAACNSALGRAELPGWLRKVKMYLTRVYKR